MSIKEAIGDESADDDERQKIKAVKKKSHIANDASVYTEQVPTNSDTFT